MNSSLFSQNLNLLRRHRAAFDIVVKLEKSYASDKYIVEQSKSGDFTLTYKETDTKSVSYHSRYNPVKEASKQADSSYKGQSHAILLGYGLGYLADEILFKLPAVSISPSLFIVEPDPGVFISAMKNRDMSSILNDARVVISVGSTADQVGDFWNTILDWTALEKLVIVDHPPSMSRFKKYFARVIEKIRYLCNRSKGNLVTIMHTGAEFHTNYFANLAESFFMPGVKRLFDKFKGVPAIIVAAGPSLDNNMHILKLVKGKFPIIAVDTALRQLVSNEIKPDIVCAADSSYENSLDFVGVENETDVILAVEAMTHPDIINSFKGPKMLMTFGGGLQSLIQGFREPVGKLVCWGSIATTVFDFAKKLGCDPLVFVGLDLSFQDGKLHAKGSYSDDILFEKVHRFSSIEHETEDYINTRGTYKIIKPNGSILFTDHNMKLYKDWFEDQFRQTSQRVINATEGGVVDKYVELIPLEKVCSLYASKAVDVAGILSEALEGEVVVNSKAMMEKLNFVLSRLRQNDSEVRKVMSKLKKLLTSSEKTHPDVLAGPQKETFFDILKFHDDLCVRKDTFNWFSMQNARLITRHTMEVNSLKVNSNAVVGDWMNEMKNFFNAVMKFHEFQTPILVESIESLKNKIKEQNKSNFPTEVSTR